jgi:hypothetical protein
VFSGKMPVWMVQMPAASEDSMRAPRRARPTPVPRNSGSDVDAVLGDAAVDAAVRDQSGRGPADDGAIALGDIPLIGEVSGVPPFPGRRLGLEGGVAGGEPAS